MDLEYILAAMEMPGLRRFSAQFLPQLTHPAFDSLRKKSPLLEDIKFSTLYYSPEASRYGIADPIVEMLARNILNVQELRLWQDPLELELTHYGLVAVARECTSLRKLSLVVDISRATTVDDTGQGVDFPGSASVERLVIGSPFLTQG
ncbi:hypothetical protein FRB96_002016 [Tulasnella sp. 330]|nr:hypothetical protein FRB96_002016 [Tulasnella sp. 330]KAG8887124.1 hypothetical protein FRB98_000484 [Tulasnella sp. 332]